MTDEDSKNAFLRSFRNSGNQYEMIVVGYGLYPTERRLLSSLPGVTYHHKKADGRMAPVRRLEDFRDLTGSMNAETPVAYWDASDVIFQSSLEPLWALTQQQPDKLLAVSEPKNYLRNQAHLDWTLSIKHPVKRKEAHDLFKRSPVLNSGFAAGTARSMNRYFSEAVRLRKGPDLHGSSDWGDQIALNLYCHLDGNRWHEAPEGWNYCVHDRSPGEVHVNADGHVVSKANTDIYVVHGNARSFKQYALVL